MIPTTISRRHPSSSWAVCLTTAALLLGLSLPGCVKSPREFLSSWRGQKAEVDESTEESAAIADAGDADSDLKTSTVSRSETDLKLPQEEFGAENLMDRLMSRRQADSDGTTTDPFVGSDGALSQAKRDSAETISQSETEVRQRAATLEELLTQTKPSSTRKPNAADSARTTKGDSDRGATSKSDRGDKNLFAADFDSRLDQLKADLHSKTDATVSKAADEVNPFADFVANNRVEKQATSDPDRRPISSVSFERKSDRGRLQREQPPLKGATLTAKDRVQTLLTQAHEDWDSWRLEDAYRKTLAAQELAVLEGVEFDVSDERPSDLAKRIASDIRKDSLASTSPKAESWTDEPAPHDDAFGQAASRAFSSFTAGTSSLGWQAAVPEASNRLPQSRAIDQRPKIELSRNGRSGVNLLPPSSDDFPSDAEGSQWASPASSEMTGTDSHHESSNAIVNLAWPDDTNPPSNNNVRSFGNGPALVRYDTEAHNPTDLSTAEESEDFLAHVAANRDRVLQSERPQWPTLPAPNTSRSNQRDGRSEQVAVAPPILLGVNDTNPSTVAAAAPGSTTPTTNAPLASVWYSRPLWFVGGLVLLMLSMRLLSRRSTTYA